MTHLSHTEVALNVAKDVVDKHLTIILDTQQFICRRPGQVNNSATLPLKNNKMNNNDECFNP